MNKIFNFGNFFVDGIDDVKLLKKAFRVLYYVFGILIGLFPIVLIIFGIGLLMDKFQGFNIVDAVFSNGWSKTVFWLLVAVFVVLIVFMFGICYAYWKKHGNRFVNSTSKYPNISFAADFIHTFNSTSVFITIFTVTVFCVLAYLFLILTGEAGFYHGANFLKYLFCALLVIIVYALSGLLSVMFVGLFTESLKLIVQIGTDIQDIADIVRTSEITVADDTVAATVLPQQNESV